MAKLITILVLTLLSAFALANQATDFDSYLGTYTRVGPPSTQQGSSLDYGYFLKDEIVAASIGKTLIRYSLVLNSEKVNATNINSLYSVTSDFYVDESTGKLYQAWTFGHYVSPTNIAALNSYLNPDSSCGLKSLKSPSANTLQMNYCGDGSPIDTLVFKGNSLELIKHDKVDALIFSSEQKVFDQIYKHD